VLFRSPHDPDVRSISHPDHEGRISMLNFDKDRFVKIQTGSVGIAGEVRALMKKLLASDGKGGGVNRLYFMGTGGVQLLTHPAIELASRLSTFPVSGEYPAQVVIDPPAALDKNSLVVILSLTGHKDTPLAQEADHNFSIFAEDDTSEEFSLSLPLALATRRPALGIEF